MFIHSHIFSTTDFDLQRSQTDLVFGMHQHLLIVPCTQDYKSLCAAVTIRVISPTVNHSDTHTEAFLTSLYE